MEEVEVPANQQMETSYASPNERGNGGGVQCRIMEENLNPEWFGEPMDIPVPESLSPIELFKPGGRVPIEDEFHIP